MFHINCNVWNTLSPKQNVWLYIILYNAFQASFTCTVLGNYLLYPAVKPTILPALRFIREPSCWPNRHVSSWLLAIVLSARI